MTYIENLSKELSPLEQMGLNFAEERKKDPNLDPVTPIATICEIARSKKISPFERARAMTIYLDNLPEAIRDILEKKRNGDMSLLNEIMAREIPKVPNAGTVNKK